MHVKGMTALHDRVPEELRGTYAGLGTPAVVDYLRDLGVTAVELLPVHQFLSEPAVTVRGLSNYWGYNSIGFFAPHAAYSSSGDRGQQVTEFKAMVKAFHAAGIEVLLDVVYNHTAEASRSGRRCPSEGSTTATSTPGSAPASSGTTATGTSPAAATPSMPPTRSRCGSSSTRCATGSARCTSTASAST